jgi:hypothetical protein
MTPREAFKLGFLQKCAADGLSNEDILARIRHAKFLKTGEWFPGQDALTTAAKVGIGGAMVLPPLAGVLGGSLLADATSRDYNTDEAKKREELAEYQRALKAMQSLHAKQHAVE